MGLHIAPGHDLPDEMVTETIAMLAKRGMGKSNAAVVLAEEMTDHGFQWVAIDPKGDWWGIRSAADGEGPGLSVPVFGGRHGDIPLEATAGTLMAKLIVERDLTCVLDVSLFSKADQIRFVTDFAEALFRAVGDDPRPLHLFLEEAEEFLPQRVEARSARMVGAYSKISKQGRALGLGVTLITQRSASLNKDALSQTDTLVLFRTVSPHDRKAVVAWAEHHDEAREVAGTLAELAPGESWILSPGFLGRMERVAWRRRRTFDSGATPTMGQRRTAPVLLADIDLAAIKEEMAETVERAKADDPKVLRKRIADLERQIQERPSETVTVEVPVEVVVERQVLDAAKVEEIISTVAPAMQALVDLRDIAREASLGRKDVPRTGIASRGAATMVGERPAQRPDPPARRQPRGETVPRPPQATDDLTLGKAERAVLTVLAQFPDGRTKPQIALLSGYSIKSSGLSNALGRLRTLGYATKGGTLTQATPEGIAALGDYDALPTGRALLEHWMGQLGKAERTVLEVMVAAFPNELTKQDVADRTGYSAASSGLSNALGRLRSLELVDGWRLSDDFADAIGSP